jgi:hypothetical protein
MDAGDIDVVTWDGTLLSGQVLAAGTIVGKVKLSGKLTISTAGASDGSEVPYGILVEDCDAVAGDLSTCIYVRGVFDSCSVILGAGHTLASIRDQLRPKGILLMTT